MISECSTYSYIGYICIIKLINIIMDALRQQGSVQIAESIYHSNKTKGSIFTAQSIVTGKDFTYKIKKSTFREITYTHIYIECGYLSFKYLGFYADGKIWKKNKIEDTSPSSLAIAWIFRMVELNQIEKLDTNVSFYHTGKCCKCGKLLTDAQSIQIGLGPYCRTH